MIVIFRCFSNCGGLILAHLSLTVAVDCPQCTKIDWALDNADYSGIQWCANNRRCRIDLDFIRSSTTETEHHLVVKGNRAIGVVFDLQFYTNLTWTRKYASASGFLANY